MKIYAFSHKDDKTYLRQFFGKEAFLSHVVEKHSEFELQTVKNVWSAYTKDQKLPLNLEPFLDNFPKQLLCALPSTCKLCQMFAAKCFIMNLSNSSDGLFTQDYSIFKDGLQKEKAIEITQPPGAFPKGTYSI